jgi:hypothetical protein
MKRESIEDNNQVRQPEVHSSGIETTREAGPATRLKPSVGAGLTMIAGDTAGVCEGDACFVPSLVGKENVG